MQLDRSVGHRCPARESNEEHTLLRIVADQCADGAQALCDADIAEPVAFITDRELAGNFLHQVRIADDAADAWRLPLDRFPQADREFRHRLTIGE